MFATQIYGTVLGAFVNYAVMISVVRGNRDLLVNSNGDSTWSGASIQSFNTNATSWALANYIYKIGAKYSIVPIGLAIGFGLVVVHRIVVVVSPTHIPPCWYLLRLATVLTLNDLSLSPRFEASCSRTSTFPSLSNTLDIFPTTSPRLASSSVSFLPASLSSSTFATIALASSRTTRT